MISDRFKRQRVPSVGHPVESGKAGEAVRDTLALRRAAESTEYGAAYRDALAAREPVFLDVIVEGSE